jgi:hypothetical protein
LSLDLIMIGWFRALGRDLVERGTSLHVAVDSEVLVASDLELGLQVRLGLRELVLARLLASFELLVEIVEDFVRLDLVELRNTLAFAHVDPFSEF